MTINPYIKSMLLLPMTTRYHLYLVECQLSETSTFQKWLADLMGGPEMALEARRSLPVVILDTLSHDKARVARHRACEGWGWGLRLAIQEIEV